MKKFLIAAAAAVLASSAAQAADMPAKVYTKAPPMVALYDWSGLYIGANGGYGSSRNCWDFTTPAGVFFAAEGCHNATGGVIGGQIGYRWQFNALIFGVEAQGDWANLKGRNTSAAFPAFGNESKVKSLGLLTGQVGYSWSNLLVYARGGAAVTNNTYSSYATATNVLASSSDNTRWGGVVGVGIEYGFAPNWSAALSYDHLFMRDSSVRFLNNGTAGAVGTLYGTDSIKQDVDLVTLRVNYRFGGLFAK